jgi:hypothetical protein
VNQEEPRRVEDNKSIRNEENREETKGAEESRREQKRTKENR